MGKSNSISIAVLTMFALLLPIAAVAETDPFPNVGDRQEIPGTRVSSSPGMTQSQWEATETLINWRAAGCPAGSGSAIAVDVSRKIWSNYCLKTWQDPAVTRAWDDYQKMVRDAQEAATNESRAWNEANPGRQKCVQWGPFTDPNGGQSSGGVCANPVPAGTAPSGSQTVEAPSVGEGDVGGTSPASSSPSASSPATSSSAAGLDPDPLPSGGVDYRGSGYPYTVTVLGQVGVNGCPTGFQAANGLISDLATRQVYTECWPERAWTAYRLGGDAWELFKATGGSYDPSVEVERRSKVDLLKAKAKEVAETAARETPGLERCSSWSGSGESGRECAYAFIAPGSSSAGASANTASGTSTTSLVVRTVTQSSTATQSPATSSSSGGVSGSATVSSSIAVGLDTVQVSGSSIDVARTALSVTADQVEAASISALAEGITGVRTLQRSLLQEMPRDSALTYRVRSVTPGVCLASSWRVRIMQPGLCLVSIEIVDSSGNSYEITKRMRRLF